MNFDVISKILLCCTAINYGVLLLPVSRLGSDLRARFRVV
jgi:hypothetical protein